MLPLEPQPQIQVLAQLGQRGYFLINFSQALSSVPISNKAVSVITCWLNLESIPVNTCVYDWELAFCPGL